MLPSSQKASLVSSSSHFQRYSLYSLRFCFLFNLHFIFWENNLHLGVNYADLQFICLFSFLLVTRIWVSGSMMHLQRTTYVRLSEELLVILLRRYDNSAFDAYWLSLVISSLYDPSAFLLSFRIITEFKQ